jgi:hypothetical protein
VVTRDIAGEDADGMQSPTEQVVYRGRGTWRAPRNVDAPYAQALGQRIDAIVSLPSDCGVLVGDDMTVRGHQWDIVGSADVRLYTRYFIRRVDIPGN